MGEEAFDEVIIAARRGTLFIRGGYGREELWLGLAKDQRLDGDPDIVVELTPLMRTRLVEALTSLPAIPTELCWFCEARIELPTDRFGGVHGDRAITCHQCRAELVTTETEDDAENLTVGLAPVRCGHGIAHDECCARCAAPEATEKPGFHADAKCGACGGPLEEHRDAVCETCTSKPLPRAAELALKPPQTEAAPDKDAFTVSLCPECGPNVGCDEDGCCPGCGATCVGNWLEEHKPVEALVDVEAQLTAANERAAVLREALEHMFDAVINGEDLHDDGCPEDDTCKCGLPRLGNAALSSNAGKQRSDEFAALKAENFQWQDAHTCLKLDFSNLETERDALKADLAALRVSCMECGADDQSGECVLKKLTTERDALREHSQKLKAAYLSLDLFNVLRRHGLYASPAYQELAERSEKARLPQAALARPEGGGQ